MNFDAFLESLDQYTERVPLAELVDRLTNVDIGVGDVREAIRFGRMSYRRNLLREGAGYQALVLCWRSGQRSPIHDHRGSSCGVLVLEGTASETLFEQNDAGHVYPVETRELHSGEVCGSEDTDIHQVSNLQPDGENLITLHIYSPALTVMGTYSLDHAGRDEIRDPVHRLADGAGI